MNLDISSSIPEEIKISSISEPKFKTRRAQDNIEGLALSILNEGLLQPIIVRPFNGAFELVAGSRRLAACRRLRWKTVLCSIVDMDDRQAFEVGLAENVARQTLNPLDEAEAFKDYVQKYGWGSEAELARKVGRSPAYVSRRLRLLKLPRDKLEEILRRHKNVSIIYEILAMDDEKLKDQLLEFSTEAKISSKEIRRLSHHVRAETDQIDWVPISSHDNEKRDRVVARAIHRTIVALRLAMYRLDEVLQSLGQEDWILKETITEQRQVLHSQIDLIYNLRRRLERRHLSGF